MKRSIFILCAIFAASPAAAQVPSLSNYAQLGPYYGNTPALASISTEHRTICLREVRSGERVCRTRAGWRAIAARIERGERWR